MKTIGQSTPTGAIVPELHWNYHKGEPSSLRWGDLVILCVERTLQDDEPYYMLTPQNLEDIMETASMEMILADEWITGDESGNVLHTFYIPVDNENLATLQRFFEKALAKLPYKMVDVIE
jgi:hypothetical protein